MINVSTTINVKPASTLKSLPISAFDLIVAFNAKWNLYWNWKTTSTAWLLNILQRDCRQNNNVIIQRSKSGSIPKFCELKLWNVIASFIAITYFRLKWPNKITTAHSENFNISVTNLRNFMKYLRQANISDIKIGAIWPFFN